jgi:hypothetical protein
VQWSAGGSQYKLLPETADTFFVSQDESYSFVVWNGVAMEILIRSGVQEARARRLP